MSKNAYLGHKGSSFGDLPTMAPPFSVAASGLASNLVDIRSDPAICTQSNSLRHLNHVVDT
jgi:hypothetical protein